VIRFRVEGVEEVVASLKRMAAAAKVASTEIARLGRAWRAVKRAAASRTRG
jgi:hypothetical protein